MKPSFILISAGAGIAALVAPASAGARKVDRDHAEYLATYPEVALVAAVANGSIFQPEAGYAALTSGARAATVGDIITITLVERTQATKNNSANMGRDASIALTPPATGPFSKLFSGSDIGSTGSQQFAGTGDASQSNALTGEISVTVVKVFPNGTLLVRGQKYLTLNRGDEFIRISGIVRPADLSPDNRVPSTRVADARITYSGKGEIARGSRQGWLSRFFSLISPF